MLLGLEPLEILRFAHYLKPKGIVITSENEVRNPDQIPNYPDNLRDRINQEFQSKAELILINTIELSGGYSTKAQNMILLGVASKHLPLKIENLEVGIKETLKEKYWKTSLGAFQVGISYEEGT